MKDVLGGILVLALLIVFGLVCWQVERKLNYSWSYRDMVRAEIQAMVKQEALK